MKDYLDSINSIINDCIDNINSLNERYTGDDVSKYKSVGNFYINFLNNIISYKKDFIKLLDEDRGFTLNHDPEVFKSKSFDLLDSNNNAISHFLTLEEDPLILQTRDGKKIVLDEKPDKIIGTSGHEIILDHDPLVISKRAKKFLVDDEPALIKFDSGKKIVLDHDPEVLRKIKNNNEDALDEYFSYSGKDIVFDDDIYVVNVKGDDKQYIFDEKPGLFLNDMNERIFVHEDESNDKFIHSFTLDHDPYKIILRDGHEFTLDHDPKCLGESNHAIILDHDPECLKMKINGREFTLDHDPEILSKDVHKHIVLDEEPLTIEIDK